MSTVKPPRAPAVPPPLATPPPPTWRIRPGRYMTAVEVAPSGMPRLPWLAEAAGTVPRRVSVPAPAGLSSYICEPLMLNRLPLGATHARGYHQRFSSAPRVPETLPYAVLLAAPVSSVQPLPE